MRFVDTPGHLYELINIKPTDTLLDVKIKLGVFPDLIKFIFAGRHLDDDTRLFSSYGIYDGGTIHIIADFRGD